jgi:hypothetical protein
LQAFTGILLCFQHAPTPGDAYNSLKCLVLTHRWRPDPQAPSLGRQHDHHRRASQIFLFGAYKRAAEAT